MSKIVWLFVALALVMPRLFATEDISTEVGEYLEKNSNDAADQAWRRKMMARLKEKASKEDFISSDQAAADIVIYDWCADKANWKYFEEDVAKRLPMPLSVKIEIARWYCLYLTNGWTFPSKIAKFITKDNWRLWIVQDNMKVIVEQK